MHVIDKLSVSGSKIHGVSRALERWIPRFDSNQFLFSIVSLRAPEAAGEIFKKIGIKVFFLNRGKFDPRTLTDLLSITKSEQPHILHLHGYGATNFGRLVSKFNNIPNIVHEHSTIPNQPFYQSLSDSLLAPLTTKAIACSEPVSEFMIKERKVQRDKLEALFYGLPLEEFAIPDKTKLTEARTQLGIFPQEQVVCNVGRLDTQKGQIYLLTAAKLVLREQPKCRFLIVGEGPDLWMLQEFAQRQYLNNKVIFTGHRDDVPNLLAMSNVVAIPSLWEGGPLTLFEAMNLKKPVVGTPVGLMEKVIQDGKTGFIVPPENSDLLAEKIIFLLKNVSLAEQMGRKGWKVCQNYDISHSVRRLSEIYMELTTQYEK